MPSGSSLEEVAAFLRDAHAERRRVRIGTDLTAERLDRILEHDPGDLTCTVESGVRLSHLRAALAAAGQRLSLDPPGDPTIGALLATNAAGPLRHRFGAPRDLILGATLVLGDGTIASSGGKVVKNVAGYDLARLACGSEGRLAFVARASFRLHPLPKAAGTLVADADDLAAVAATLLGSQLQPSALDLLHPGRVAVLFEGSPGAVDAQLTEARRLVGGDKADLSVWDESRGRQGVSRGRVRFAPGDLAAVLQRMSEAVVRPSAGVAYTALESAREDPPQVHSRGAEALVERIRRELDPGGVLSG